MRLQNMMVWLRADEMMKTLLKVWEGFVLSLNANTNLT
jgi:hypothetical protein